MTPILTNVDALLRGRWATAAPRRPRTRHLLATLLVFGVAYGAVMGTFGGVHGGRAWQPLYSGLKVPLLLMATFGLSLPSFFVLNTILGVRSDFVEVVRTLAASQAALTVVLASLAPFTGLWYLSFTHYQAALLFNAAMFAAASFSAQALLRKWYRPLIERNPRHLVLLRVWIVIYAFVGIQMAWILRPFIGSPTMATQFFRDEQWGNAYVEVVHAAMQVIGR